MWCEKALQGKQVMAESLVLPGCGISYLLELLYLLELRTGCSCIPWDFGGT